jgi:hypothetical protein
MGSVKNLVRGDTWTLDAILDVGQDRMPLAGAAVTAHLCFADRAHVLDAVTCTVTDEAGQVQAEFAADDTDTIAPGDYLLIFRVVTATDKIYTWEPAVVTVVEDCA